MKTCIDCQQTKPYADFVAKASCKDGYEVRCRRCRTIRYNKKNPLKVFQKIYGTQLINSIKRGHPAPAYNFEELIQWLDQQSELISMWEAWVAADYSKDLKPSVDRIDDSLPYSLDNIQLMVWRDNYLKAAQAKKDGIIDMGHRPVRALHLNGEPYATFPSTIEAARHVQGKTWGICSVANGVPVKDGRGRLYQPKTYKGYVWSWLTD